MKTEHLIIEPKSQPNWKDALLIVLLTFFIMKSNNSIVNIFVIIIASVLTLNFIGTFFLLFRFNLTKLGSKILIDTKNNVVIFQNKKNEQSKILELKINKIPYNNLYFLRFSTDLSKKMNTIILNEQELNLTKNYLNIGV